MGFDDRVRFGKSFGNLIRGAALLFLLLTLFSLPSCGDGNEKGTGRIRVGYLKNDLHQLPFYVAKEKGYFEEEGLEVAEGIAFNAGPEEMGAFSAGELDMGYVGCAPAVTFQARKMADVRIVAQSNQSGSALVVRAGLEADDVHGLKGRIVALPGLSTVQDFLLKMAIREAGMRTEDLTTVIMSPPEMVTALSGGSVDSFLAWEPYPSQAVGQRVGRILMESDDIWEGHPCCVVLADKDFLDREPLKVRKFVRAHIRAVEYINENKDEAVDMACAFTGFTKEVVSRAMENVRFRSRLDEKGVSRYVDFLYRSGIITVSDPTGFVREIIHGEFVPGGGR